MNPLPAAFSNAAASARSSASQNAWLFSLSSVSVSVGRAAGAAASRRISSRMLARTIPLRHGSEYRYVACGPRHGRDLRHLGAKALPPGLSGSLHLEKLFPRRRQSGREVPQRLVVEDHERLEHQAGAQLPPPLAQLFERERAEL